MKKIEVLKRANKWTFPKGLVHGFFPKIEFSVIGVFLQKSYQKTSFLILWKEKNDFKWKKLKF